MSLERDVMVGSGFGTLVGAVTANRLAKEAAKRKGLKPGSDEYKRFVKKFKLKLIGSTTIAGGSGAAASHAYIQLMEKLGKRKR